MDDTGSDGSGLHSTVLETLRHHRDDAREPWTAPELTEVLGEPRSRVFTVLQDLADDGEVRSKKIGARGRVWWPAEPTDDALLSSEPTVDDDDGDVGRNRSVTRSELLDALLHASDDPREPWSVPQLADRFDCSTDYPVEHRLWELHDAGIAATKKVGSRARVWWVPVTVSTDTRSTTADSTAE